jgi:hypothetical protein
MECELLLSCGFFRKYSTSHQLVCQSLIYKYCRGGEMQNCKRLEYNKKYGSPPPVNMLPSGVMLNEKE